VKAVVHEKARTFGSRDVSAGTVARALSVAVAALLLLMGIPDPARATQVYGPFPWAKRTIYVNDNTGAYWRPIVTTAIRGWNHGGSVHLVHASSCRPGFPCVHVRSTYWSSDVVGQTTMRWPGGVLTYARVVMNREYNRFPSYFRQAAMVHELGHAIGLFHETSTGSVMWPATYRTWPSAYDFGLVRRAYSGVPW
jgi:hypothetical protein